VVEIEPPPDACSVIVELADDVGTVLEATTSVEVAIGSTTSESVDVATDSPTTGFVEVATSPVKTTTTGAVVEATVSDTGVTGG
jgi:hypothetical protein